MSMISISWSISCCWCYTIGICYENWCYTVGVGDYSVDHGHKISQDMKMRSRVMLSAIHRLLLVLHTHIDDHLLDCPCRVATSQRRWANHPCDGAMRWTQDFTMREASCTRYPSRCRPAPPLHLREWALSILHPTNLNLLCNKSWSWTWSHTAHTTTSISQGELTFNYEIWVLTWLDCVRRQKMHLHFLVLRTTEDVMFLVAAVGSFFTEPLLA